MTEFTDGEVAALRIILGFAASKCVTKTDVTEVFIESGAFKCFEGTDGSVIGLIKKLDSKKDFVDKLGLNTWIFKLPKDEIDDGKANGCE